jgi:predicted DNA-binding helix-hairpin-helix protein
MSPGFEVFTMVSFNHSARDLEIDPKVAWALEHREQFPVNLNEAPRETLLRVPGLGERAVDRILELRRERPIAAADVRKLRVNWYQVRYYVSASDHCPRQRVPETRPTAVVTDTPPWSGLPLFEAAFSRQ